MWPFRRRRACDAGRQNALAVGVVLCVEKLGAGHAYYARLDDEFILGPAPLPGTSGHRIWQIAHRIEHERNTYIKYI